MSETSDAGNMVRAYLQSKGLQPTGENVSRALQMNAQNPGLIKGLVNQEPPAPAQQAATDAASAHPSLAPRTPPAQQSMPTPPIPPPQGGPSMELPQINVTPQDDGSGLARILGLGGAGSAALYALSKLFGGGAAATPPVAAPTAPAAQVPVAQPTQAPAPATTSQAEPAGRAEIPFKPNYGQDATVALPPPANTVVDPMQSAMTRAVEGPPSRGLTQIAKRAAMLRGIRVP